MRTLTMKLSHPRTRAGCAALLMLLAGAAASQAAVTLINFDDIPAPATLTAQYGTRGVVFANHFLRVDPTARSGTQVLQSVNPSDFEFDPFPLVMSFTSPQARVKFFAGVPVLPLTGTLRVYDANNNVVGTDGPKQVAADTFNTAFEVSMNSAVIMRAEFQLEGSAFEEIDDLEFEGEPPAPPPPTAPVVTITAPVNGADVDVTTLDISGTVTGEGLLSPVKLTVEFRRPPGTTAPVFTSALVLTGTGTTRQFTLPGGFNNPPLGPITVTVEAENVGAMKGSASVSINNLPAAIRDRVESEGGTAELGDFVFGIIRSDCKIAIYEEAAISATPGGVTHKIGGLILPKWRTLEAADEFGCPLGEERTSSAGVRVQDFDGGRIYVVIVDGAPEAIYVPAVFTNAIDMRGGEAATGVPLADPVSPVEPVQNTTNTWLFQQFRRLNRPDLLPSTLEIRGNPPTLWLERQGGDLTIDTMATIWEEFPCDGNLGPCTVEPPPVHTPIPNAGDVACGGEALEEDRLGTILDGGRPEWSPLLGHYVSTPLNGVVRTSALAGEDFFASHKWFYNCPFETVRPDCPSDWTLHVRTIGPHVDIGDFPSLFAAGNPDEIELEYERFYAEFVVWMGFPQPGDLIHATGRWIIDCGHANFKSELHPIHSLAKMTTVTGRIEPFTGIPEDDPFRGQPATRADVWVNGWYPGLNPIDLDIYPPPRPTPTARLVVQKPVDEDAAFGLNIEYGFEPPGAASHVHLTFTAELQENFIDVWGEVSYEHNREYAGQWWLFWSP